MAQHQEFFNTHKPKSTYQIFTHVLQQIDTPPGIAYDLCCGTGKLTAELRQRGYQAYGIDLSSVFIGIDGASANGYMIGDVKTLPLPTNSATLVCCIDSLQYFDNPESVIAEVSRILKPGGCLILSTQNNNNPAGLKKWLIKKLRGEDWSPWLQHPIENFVTYDWLLRTLHQHGLEADYVRGKQFLTAWVSLLPAFIRNWTPWPGKAWRSLGSVAARTNLPDFIEESAFARFAMIVLIRAHKIH